MRTDKDAAILAEGVPRRPWYDRGDGRPMTGDEEAEQGLAIARALTAAQAARDAADPLRSALRLTADEAAALAAADVRVAEIEQGCETLRREIGRREFSTWKRGESEAAYNRRRQVELVENTELAARLAMMEAQAALARHDRSALLRDVERARRARVAALGGH